MSINLTKYGLNRQAFVNGSSASSVNFSIPDVGYFNGARLMYLVMNYGLTTDGARLQLQIRDTASTTTARPFKYRTAGTATSSTYGSTSSASSLMPLHYQQQGSTNDTAPNGETGTVNMFIYNKWTGAGNSLSLPRWWGTTAHSYTNGYEYFSTFHGRVFAANSTSQFNDAINSFYFYPSSGTLSFYNISLFYIGGQ